MDHTSSHYTLKIGNTTFIVKIKQSDSASKPLDMVLKDICRHEIFDGSFIEPNDLADNEKSS